MLRHPRMVGCALDGEVERDFHPAVAARRDERAKVAKRAKLRMHGIVTAEPATDRVGASRITGRRAKRVVATLAVLFADRMNGDEVDRVETHRRNLIEARDAILEARAAPLDRTLRPRK